MNTLLSRSILIVSGDEQVKNVFGQITDQIDCSHVWAETGEAALAIIHQNNNFFCLVLCDQRLNGISSIQFLEQAKSLLPFTPLFLIGDAPDINDVISGVNKGLIHRYLEKPLKPDTLADMVQSGVKLHASHLENEKLMDLAKKQNTQLFDLSCQLMEAGKTHNAKIIALEKEIEQLTGMIKTHRKISPSQKCGDLFPAINTFIEQSGKSPADGLADLLHGALKQLYTDFSALADQNGFKMPAIHQKEIP